jgi:hypothetical protein
MLPSLHHHFIGHAQALRMPLKCGFAVLINGHRPQDRSSNIDIIASRPKNRLPSHFPVSCFALPFGAMDWPQIAKISDYSSVALLARIRSGDPAVRFFDFGFGC